MEAVASLLAFLSSQFYTYDFSSGNTLLALENDPNDDTESGIGRHFRIRFPTLPVEERYAFEYIDIQTPEFSAIQYPY